MSDTTTWVADTSNIPCAIPPKSELETAVSGGIPLEIPNDLIPFGYMILFRKPDDRINHCCRNKQDAGEVHCFDCFSQSRDSVNPSLRLRLAKETRGLIEEDIGLCNRSIKVSWVFMEKCVAPQAKPCH